MEAYQQHIFLSDICVQPQRCRGDKVLIVDHTFKKKDHLYSADVTAHFPKEQSKCS